MHRGPDTSLIEAAREMAPIVREHSAQAEQERRLSQPVLMHCGETGLLRMNTPVHSGAWRPTPSLRARG